MAFGRPSTWELRGFGQAQLSGRGCPHAEQGGALLKYDLEDHFDRHSYVVTCPFCSRSVLVWESMV